MSWRRSKIMKSTPSVPPKSARKKMRQYSVLSEKPRNISAGMVKITPAAADSPAEPVVCTMLFSRIVDRPNARRMLIERTAMGIEAETVSPARSPTYTETAPNKTPNSAPSTIARRLNSATLSSASTYGRNSPGGAVELQGFVDTLCLPSDTVMRGRICRCAACSGAGKLASAVQAGKPQSPLPEQVTARPTHRIACICGAERAPPQGWGTPGTAEISCLERDLLVPQCD